jgi:hypothetical protein
VKRNKLQQPSLDIPKRSGTVANEKGDMIIPRKENMIHGDDLSSKYFCSLVKNDGRPKLIGGSNITVLSFSITRGNFFFTEKVLFSKLFNSSGNVSLFLVGCHLCCRLSQGTFLYTSGLRLTRLWQSIGMF